MLVRRHYLVLALLLLVGAGAIIAASALVFAEDRSHVDHAQHVHDEAAAPIMRSGVNFPCRQPNHAPTVSLCAACRETPKSGQLPDVS